MVAPTEKSAHVVAPAYADAIGLGIIAVELTILFCWLVPDDGTRVIAGIVAYGVLVWLALSMWHGKHAAKFSDAYDWAKLFVGSILVGSLFLALT